MTPRPPKKGPRKAGPSTQAVHAGQPRSKPGDALTTPVFQTATYVFRNTAELRDYMDGRIRREEYGRYGNPTVREAERKIAELEGGEAGLLCSSGMAAVTTTLLAMLRAGQHVLLTDDCYRRTRQFAGQFLTRLGIEVSMVPTDDYKKIEASIRKNTRLFITESPTNPYLNVLDLERLVEIGRRHDLKILIDATFATPVNQRPIEFGVDLVLHSATKYLGGHNDLLAGAIVGREGIVAAIREAQGVLGSVSDPHSAYLLIRGLKTLALRVERQNASAQRIAEFLEGHPGVRRVYYPGLKSHPQHGVARRQMKGFGGVVSFEVEGGIQEATRVVDAVRIPYLAPSLGGVESLIEQPALMSFYELTSEERAAIGIKDNLVRYSVGIEDPEDLVEDLRQALDQI